MLFLTTFNNFGSPEAQAVPRKKLSDMPMRDVMNSLMYLDQNTDVLGEDYSLETADSLRAAVDDRIDWSRVEHDQETTVHNADDFMNFLNDFIKRSPLYVQDFEFFVQPWMLLGDGDVSDESRAAMKGWTVEQTVLREWDGYRWTKTVMQLLHEPTGSRWEAELSGNNRDDLGWVRTDMGILHPVSGDTLPVVDSAPAVEEIPEVYGYDVPAVANSVETVAEPVDSGNSSEGEATEGDSMDEEASPVGYYIDTEGQTMDPQYTTHQEEAHDEVQVGAPSDSEKLEEVSGSEEVSTSPNEETQVWSPAVDEDDEDQSEVDSFMQTITEDAGNTDELTAEEFAVEGENNETPLDLPTTEESPVEESPVDDEETTNDEQPVEEVVEEKKVEDDKWSLFRRPLGL